MRFRRLSFAAKTALVVPVVMVVAALIYWPLVWMPPLLFGIVCLVAPFCYRRGFFLPVIARCKKDSRAVALTFDDGPDPVSTPILLSLLAAHGVQATFFVVGRRVRMYPELVRAIMGAGHTLGNHSFNHDSLLAFKKRQYLYNDIAATQRELGRLGVVPRVFRPPVGITYPGLGAVLKALGLTAVTFSCRARDRGNKSVRHLSRRILRKAAPGDIIMLHDLAPGPKDLNRWSAEVDAVLTGLNAGSLAVRPLGELIGRPIDNRDENGERTVPKG
jgi:peptidoglycan/xylan/chitin deacetylase (PgdA/CDA1 family)